MLQNTTMKYVYFDTRTHACLSVYFSLADKNLFLWSLNEFYANYPPARNHTRDRVPVQEPRAATQTTDYQPPAGFTQVRL